MTKNDIMSWNNIMIYIRIDVRCISDIMWGSTEDFPISVCLNSSVNGVSQAVILNTHIRRASKYYILYED